MITSRESHRGPSRATNNSTRDFAMTHPSHSPPHPQLGLRHACSWPRRGVAWAQPPAPLTDLYEAGIDFASYKQFGSCRERERDALDPPPWVEKPNAREWRWRKTARISSSRRSESRERGQSRAAGKYKIVKEPNRPALCSSRSGISASRRTLAPPAKRKTSDAWAPAP